MLDRRLIKFLFAGIINTVFGYAVYAFLIFVNLSYPVALFAATVAGVIFNYFSFGQLAFSSQGGRQAFAKFVIAYSVVYLVNAFLLTLLTDNFYLNPYVGQAVCLPLSVLLSWLLMNHWVYRKG